MSKPESKSIPSSSQQSDVLKVLREQLFAEGILHEGDTIGTDDLTLLYVFDGPISQFKAN